MRLHTPGPWTAEPNGGDDEDPRKLFICAGGDKITVAEAFTGLDEDAEANAALIAAAPDLLAALKRILMTGEIPDYANAVLAARAAIAKAEGGS